MERIQALAGSQLVAPTHLAFAHIALREFDNAFEQLEDSCRIHDVMLLYVNVLPMFEVLRDDVRFGELVTRIGLQG